MRYILFFLIFLLVFMPLMSSDADNAPFVIFRVLEIEDEGKLERYDRLATDYDYLYRGSGIIRFEIEYNAPGFVKCVLLKNGKAADIWIEGVFERDQVEYDWKTDQDEGNTDYLWDVVFFDYNDEVVTRADMIIRIERSIVENKGRYLLVGFFVISSLFTVVLLFRFKKVGARQ